MSKLFPKVEFQLDETPMSWAARQAAFHRGSGVVPFLNDLGIPVADLARGRQSAVERLCDVAGQGIGPVMNNTITAVAKRRYRLRGHSFSAEFTTGVVTRFCPMCLKQDVTRADDLRVALRHRVHWRLAPYRTCSEHQLPLSDIRLGHWSDMAHELQSMTREISEEQAAVYDRVQRAPSPVQRYVERRLSGETGPKWLDFQDIDIACRAAEMLGGLMLFGPGQKASDMTEDMWDAAGRAVWPVLESGPKAIRDVLAQSLKGCLRKNGYPSPRKAFGMLYGWLFASRISKDPGPILEIVRDVTIDQVPLVPGQMLLGRPVARPHLAYISSIAGAEGLHPKTLTNVLRVAGLIGDDTDLKGARNVVADYARAKALIDTAKYAVPVTQVPDMLTASRPMVAELIKIGQLTRIQGHGQLQSKLGKAIDGRSIRNTLNLVESIGEAVDAPPEGYVALAKAAERSRVSLRAILEMLFSGYLKKVYRLNGQHGFSRVLVSPVEIMECIQDPPPNASDEIRFCMG